MRNPHGVEPTQFMKKEDNDDTIKCDSNDGILFCNGQLSGSDLYIANNCNRENRCWVGNDGTIGYECHPVYKSSLFVNTNHNDECNYFTILDYEVFTHQ